MKNLRIWHSSKIFHEPHDFRSFYESFPSIIYTQAIFFTERGAINGRALESLMRRATSNTTTISGVSGSVAVFPLLKVLSATLKELLDIKSTIKGVCDAGVATGAALLPCILVGAVVVTGFDLPDNSGFLPGASAALEDFAKLMQQNVTVCLEAGEVGVQKDVAVYGVRGLGIFFSNSGFFPE